MLGPWLRCRLLAAFALLAAQVCAAEESAEAREAQLRAAYVFNFVKFIDWGTHAPVDALTICFRGAGDVRDRLAAATKDKRLGTRSILVRALAAAESAASCQVLYAGQATERESRAAADSQMLTIGEAEDFTRKGGIIRLYTHNNRLRFVINVGNARQAGLQVSSNLLKLATEVESEATP